MVARKTQPHGHALHRLAYTERAGVHPRGPDAVATGAVAVAHMQAAAPLAGRRKAERMHEVAVLPQQPPQRAQQRRRLGLAGRPVRRPHLHHMHADLRARGSRRLHRRGSALPQDPGRGGREWAVDTPASPACVTVQQSRITTLLHAQSRMPRDASGSGIQRHRARLVLNAILATVEDEQEGQCRLAASAG